MIKNLCHELGVHTEPMRISGVWIAPIYSWYHASFDREPDVPGAPAVEKVCQPCAAGCCIGEPNARTPVAPQHHAQLISPALACIFFSTKLQVDILK